MAKLINCKDCGAQISKNANSCPQCGAKNKKTSIITWLVLIFIGVPFLWSILNGASSDKAPRIDQHVSENVDIKETSPYETLDKFYASESDFDSYIGSRITVVEMLVRKQMKDPDSTKFRNWHYVKAETDLPATVCGEVSAKNSFNGYTGFKKFLFKTDTTEFGIEGSTKNFSDEYNKLCVLK